MTEIFDSILMRRLSRRDWFAATSATAFSALVAPGVVVAGGTLRRPRAPLAPGAAAPAAVAPGKQDALRLAPGHHYGLVARWGDSLWKDTPPLEAAQITRGELTAAGAAARQQRQFGTNCDALAYFPLQRGGSRRGVLCVNHEYVQAELTFAGLARSGAERARDRKEWIEAHPQAVAWMQAAHGVSILQITRSRRGWGYTPGHPLTRRITAATPMELMGPARGAPLLCTSADPSGTRVLGTFANCAGGKTPWGTYLTAEENIDDYFGHYRSWASGTDDFALLDAHARFPLGQQSLYGWEHADARFDMRSEPHEPLRHGWIVEIDPLDPQSTPKKRTALGRFSHEGANTILARDGRVATYMGDDDKFEYVYKFVSTQRFDPANRAANRDLLDSGTLYAARFNADGNGDWLPLVHDESGPLNRSAGFANQAEVLIKVRAAADRLGATPMDRPEDVEPNPVTGRVYIACTKNPDREREARLDYVTNREVDLGAAAANPRSRNDFGHIIELIEADDDASAIRFSWNVFLLAGNPQAPDGRLLTNQADLVAGSLQREDTYFAGYPDASQLSPIACPDNLGFDPSGRLWIVTDTEDKTLPNNGCFVVPTAGPDRGLLRQIASGPTGSEICGCEFTPDGRTLFLSIQHPGEGGTVNQPVSHWPDGGVSPARAAVVAIMRDDGEPL